MICFLVYQTLPVKTTPSCAPTAFDFINCTKLPARLGGLVGDGEGGLCVCVCVRFEGGLMLTLFMVFGRHLLWVDVVCCWRHCLHAIERMFSFDFEMWSAELYAVGGWSTGGAPGPDPLRQPPPPPPPCRVLAPKCRTMGAEGALRKFCLT